VKAECGPNNRSNREERKKEGRKEGRKEGQYSWDEFKESKEFKEVEKFYTLHHPRSNLPLRSCASKK